LKDTRVRAVRLRVAADQTEPLVVRAINLRLLVEVSGVVRNPGAVVGDGNVAAVEADTEFAHPLGSCSTPVINRGFTLKLNSGGQPCSFSGPISGSGRVELHAGGRDAPLVLDGKAANTLSGTWSVKAGTVVLAKEPGTDAMGSAVVVGGAGGNEALVLAAD